MITIHVNHEQQSLDKDQSINDFLAQQPLKNRCAAIAVNHHFIPRSHYDSTWLHDGDYLDFITPMQGG